MNFDSAAFGAFAVAAIFALNLFRKPGLRLWAVFALNAAFIATFVAAPLQVLPLLGFLVAGYGAIIGASLVGSKGLAALIVSLIVLFIWLKKYTIIAFLPAIEMVYLQVGLSYILFRILHLMVDANQKVIARPGPVTYLSYVTFFLSFVSGPIQRYEDFSAQMSSPNFPTTFVEMDFAFGRILRGLLLILVTVFTSSAFDRSKIRLHESLVAGHHGLALVVEFSSSAAIFLIHLYLNFVAYMEIVIGIGILCGFRLPENFDRPYLAKNFLDLWSRWHMTLSGWFKFYLFNPLLKALAGRWPAPKLLPYLGAVAFFLTFTTMGIWHGSTSIFLLYGMILGIGAGGNKLFQTYAIDALGKRRYKALTERRWYRHLSRGATLAFFALGVACVWIDSRMGGLLIDVGGLKLVSVSFVLLWTLATFLSWFGECVSQIRVPNLRLVRWPNWSLPVTTGLKLFLIVTAMTVLDTSTPDFVYKAF